MANINWAAFRDRALDSMTTAGLMTTDSDAKMAINIVCVDKAGTSTQQVFAFNVATMANILQKMDDGAKCFYDMKAIYREVQTHAQIVLKEPLLRQIMKKACREFKMKNYEELYCLTLGASEKSDGDIVTVTECVSWTKDKKPEQKKPSKPLYDNKQLTEDKDKGTAPVDKTTKIEDEKRRKEAARKRIAENKLRKEQRAKKAQKKKRNVYG